jgi:hypothetical protein
VITKLLIMKKLIYLFFFLFLSIFSYAQYVSNSPTVKSSFTKGYIPPTQSYNIQKGGVKNEYAEMVIDGKTVMGFPFIFYDWSAGSITLQDGKYYTGYKLKYDIYGQTILFLNGDKSLEVDGDIKEFTLLTPESNFIKFINGKSFTKQKGNLYYEVLADAEKGMLLKIYKKVVTSIINQIIDVQGTKYLEMQTEYFYFDRVSKKVLPVKNEKADIEKILKIDSENSEKLQLITYNFAEEKEFISFFKIFLK